VDAFDSFRGKKSLSYKDSNKYYSIKTFVNITYYVRFMSFYKSTLFIRIRIITIFLGHSQRYKMKNIITRSRVSVKHIVFRIEDRRIPRV